MVSVDGAYAAGLRRRAHRGELGLGVGGEAIDRDHHGKPNDCTFSMCRVK